ncbi:peptidylprolyl isomerase [Catellatospora sp. NPDC049609]|uniref:peptidylprolyl isomerase n=1 Tax=Catellatospora sp. NPDC049609 TaxID=3155505 RepID=UPI003427D9A6
MDIDGETTPAAPRRRTPQLVAGVVAVLLAAGAAFAVWQLTRSDDAGTPVAAASSGPPEQLVSCRSRPEPAPGARQVGAVPTAAPGAGTVVLAVTTNLGVIEIVMDRARTPCTAGFLSFLAGAKFFDGTECHRLVTGSLKVLQCGDPTGTGAGGPGFAFDEENLPGLAPTPTPTPSPSCAGVTVVEGESVPGGGMRITVPSGLAPSGNFVIKMPGAAVEGGLGCPFARQREVPEIMYPRGRVAMANRGQPGTSGSQFFFVYDDSRLGASYTPFGRVATGMEIIDQVAAGGVVAGAGTDGRPVTALTILNVTVRPA